MPDTHRKGPWKFNGPTLACALLLCLTLTPAAARAVDALSGDHKAFVADENTADSPAATIEVVDGEDSAKKPAADGGSAKKTAKDDVATTELAAQSKDAEIKVSAEDNGDKDTAGDICVAQADDTLIATTTPDMIDKNGYLALSITRDQIEAAFDYGDLLNVSVNGQTFTAPLSEDRTFVDQLQPAIVVRQKSDGQYVVELGADNDKFASTYGIAEKHKDAKNNTVWTFAPGVSDPLTVTISLAEKGGYHDRYIVKQLRYTDKRTDYPQLTDEQFANFREVTTTGIAHGVLYRSATPVNPQRGRNTYADACIKKAGVTYAVNMSDAEEKLVKYRGYDQSYYASIDHIALHASIHLDSDEYKADLMRGFRAMSENRGVYLIHCLEGKDRTGIAVGLLELLMGASYDEMVADHMVSFYNYFGITEADPRYESIVHGNFTAFLEAYLGVDDLKTCGDLQQKTESFMLANGLSADELAQLKHNLNPEADARKDEQAEQPTVTKGTDKTDDGKDATKNNELPAVSDQAGVTDSTDTKPNVNTRKSLVATTSTPAEANDASSISDTKPNESTTASTENNSVATSAPTANTSSYGNSAAATSSNSYGNSATSNGAYGSSASDSKDSSQYGYGSSASNGNNAASGNANRNGSGYPQNNGGYSNGNGSSQNGNASNGGNYPQSNASDDDMDRYKNPPTNDNQPNLPKTSDPYNQTAVLAAALAGMVLLGLGIRKARNSFSR